MLDGGHERATVEFGGDTRRLPLHDRRKVIQGGGEELKGGGTQHVGKGAGWGRLGWMRRFGGDRARRAPEVPGKASLGRLWNVDVELDFRKWPGSTSYFRRSQAFEELQEGQGYSS